MNGRKAFLVGAVALAVASVDTSATALDGKRYVGSFCHFKYGSVTGVTRSPPKFTNTSGSTQNVICPVLQDVIDSDVEYAEIIGSDAINETTCFFSERRASGGNSIWAHEDVVDAGGGYDTIRWAVGPPNLTTSANATYAIYCDVPSSSSILMYRVDDV